MKVSMHVEGLEAMRKTLRTLPAALQKKTLGNAVAAGARLIADEAKARAPRLTGTLISMIRSTRGVPRDGESSAFVSVRKMTKKAMVKAKKKRGSNGKIPGDAFYWRFLEFGTSKMKAIPFLRPAFESKKVAAVYAVAEKLKEGLDAAVQDARK